MKRFLSKWLKQNKSADIERRNRIEPKITNNIGDKDSSKHGDVALHPDELFLDFEVTEESKSTENLSKLSQTNLSEQPHDNEFDNFGDLRTHQNNKAPYINEFGGFEDLGDPKKGKIDTSSGFEQTDDAPSELTKNETDKNEFVEVVDDFSHDVKKQGDVCKFCQSSLTGIFSSQPIDFCANCGNLAEAGSRESEDQISVNDQHENARPNRSNYDHENSDTVTSGQIWTKSRKQTAIENQKAAYKTLPDFTDNQKETEQFSKKENNNDNDLPLEDVFEGDIADELLPPDADDETYPNFGETFSNFVEIEPRLSDASFDDYKVDAEHGIGDDFDDFSKYKNSNDETQKDDHENNSFVEYFNDVEDWEIYLDEDLEEQKPGYLEYYEDEDPLETENIISYATRLTISSNLPRESERKYAVGFYIRVLGDFPYYQSYAAIERLLERGSSIHHIADVHKIKYLWATNPFLWANRRFDKLESGWKINPIPSARNSMSWQMASDLVKNFSVVELENLILVDWYNDWINLEFIDYNSASGLAPAYGMYSSYLSEMRNKRHSMVNRW